MSTRTAILGGGIAGLATAWRLRETYPEESVVIFEAAEQAGGKIRTARFDGLVMEEGPDSLLTEKPWAIELCRELGLKDQLIPSNDAERSFSILRKGQLHPFPTGCKLFIPQEIKPMISTPLLSPAGKIRMGMELFKKFPSQEDDESLAAFVTRHFGQEALDRLASPLLAGIYGGDPQLMSMEATFPRLRAMERTHGSLIKGMREAMKKMAQRPGPPPALFTSMKDGMQVLTDELASRLSTDLRLNTKVQTLRKEGEAWTVNGEQFDRVICALPARTSAVLFRKIDEELSAHLEKQRATSSGTLSLVFKAENVDKPPSGFGFMSAHPIPGLVVGCTWTSNKFVARKSKDYFVCRVFLGGSETGRLQLENASDEDLCEKALRELRQICPWVPETPQHQNLCRWPTSNPQYDVGHLQWVEDLRTKALGVGDLYFCGSSYEGISVSDCVKQANDLVQSLQEKQ